MTLDIPDIFKMSKAVQTVQDTRKSGHFGHTPLGVSGMSRLCPDICGVSASVQSNLDQPPTIAYTSGMEPQKNGNPFMALVLVGVWYLVGFVLTIGLYIGVPLLIVVALIKFIFG